MRYLLLRLFLVPIAYSWRIRLREDCSKDPGNDAGRVNDADSIFAGSRPASVLFLHGNMFPVWQLFRGGRGVPVISQSADGRLLSQLLERGWGYDTILRGSSSRGGREVLAQMTRMLGDRSVLVTPDGPRGPRGEVKAGGVVAAYRAGVPLLILDVRCRSAIRFRSWDRMMLPMPFASVYIRYCTIDTSTTNLNVSALIDAARAILAGNSKA